MSIAEGPVTVVVKREAMSPASEGRRDSSNRASIIQVKIQFIVQDLVLVPITTIISFRGWANRHVLVLLAL